MPGISLHTNLFRTNKVVCIEVLYGDQGLSYNLLILKREKNKLLFDNIKPDIKSVEDLKEALPSNVPVVLNISGKGVLFRRFTSIEESSIEQIIQKILPNAKAQDFYIDQNKINEEKSFISIIRKELIADIFEKFRNISNFIVDISWGPFCIDSVIGLLEASHDQIKTSCYNVNLKDEVINSCCIVKSQTDEKYKLGDEYLDYQSIVPFASGYRYLIENNGKSLSRIQQVSENNKEYRAFEMIKKLGIGVLGFLFGVLMINYFVFEHYNSGYNEIYEKLSRYQGFISTYNKLNKELEDKKTILAETGFSRASYLSYYADQIAATIPQGIRLTEVDFNPVFKRKRQEEGIEFIRETIIISGLSSKSTLFNDWMKLLKEFDWVKEVGNFSYKTDIEKSNDPASFSIEIMIK